MVTDRPPAKLLAAALLAIALTLPGCASRPAGTRQITTGDGASLSVTKVELPYRACDKPQKVGESIYLVVSRGEDKGSSIVRYDPLRRKAETIVETTDPQLIGWFVVNDEWLVWSVEQELFARRLRTGEQQLLSTSRDLCAPALRGDLVAWDGLTKERTHQMVVRDLASGVTTAIAPVVLADLYNNFPAWDGRRLVWTDVIDGMGVYRSYDSSTGVVADHEITQDDFRYPGYAQAAGERIYSINFDRVDEWDWGVQRLGYFSAVAKRFVPIVPEGFVANSLVVAGGLVAVVDSEQELTVRAADEPHGAVYRPVRGRVDFVQASSDGTLIAWREAANETGRCLLFLIERH